MALNRLIVRGACPFMLCFFAGVAYAASDNDQARAIAKQNACLGCHAVSKKIVGPSYQDVALRYRNNPQAIAFLKNKIRNGGVGSWGVVPMPANSKLSDSDLSLVAQWILDGAPGPNWAMNHKEYPLISC